MITSWFPRWSSGQSGPGLLAHVETLSQEVRERWMGHWTQRSTDSGVTGGTGQECGLYPHGPVELDDGRLLYLGSGTFDGTPGRRQIRSSLDSISGIIRNKKPKPAKLSVGSTAIRAWSP